MYKIKLQKNHVKKKMYVKTGIMQLEKMVCNQKNNWYET